MAGSPDQYSWHWLFLINVPVGLIVAGTAWTCLDIDKPDWSLRRNFDLFGLVLMASFLAALEYVLEEGNRWDWFQDETIAWCGVIDGCSWRIVLPAHADAARSVGGSARIRQCQLRVRLAVQFRAGPWGCTARCIWCRCSSGACAVTTVSQIGETMFVTGAAMFLSAPIAGQLARFVDLRVMLAFGLVMFGSGLWWMASLTVQLGVLGTVWASGAAQ